MAPPNSSSFSVRVVLPAVGVRDDREGAATRPLRRSGSSFQRDREKDGPQFYQPASGGCGCARLSLRPGHPRGRRRPGSTRAGVPSPRIPSTGTARSRAIRRSDLEQCVVHSGLSCAIEQQKEHLAADVASAQVGAHAEIEDVRLAARPWPRCRRRRSRGRAPPPAQIPDAQAVAEDALAPGIGIRGALDGADAGTSPGTMARKRTRTRTRTRQLGCARRSRRTPARLSSSRKLRRASSRSCQALRFSPGLRSRYAG
jgi:hypothetical protein